jgi:O-antigen ligase
LPSQLVLVAICLLPGALYGGVALQSAGLQFFILMAGFWLLRSGAITQERALLLRRVGVVLVSFWLVGILANIFNAILGYLGFVDGNQGVTASFKVLVTSRVPSTVVISGCVSLILGNLARSGPKQEEPVAIGPAPGKKMFDVFVIACAAWTVVFFSYLLWQHFTGFDHRMPGNILPYHFQLPNGNYRIRGLYGHPLSMAAINLAFLFLFAFIAAAPKDACRPLIRFLSAYVAISHLILLSLTGGRTALAAGILGLPAAFIIRFLPRFGVKRMALAGVGSAALATWIGLGTGTGQRFAEVFTTKIDRFEFWKVHAKIWFSNPLIGRGPGYLDNGLRDWFYDMYGPENFTEHAVAHNVFLQALADMGIVGIASAAVTFFVMLSCLRRTLHSPLSQAIIQGLVFAFIANLMHGLTQNTYFDANVTVVYLAFYFVTLFLVWKDDDTTSGAPFYLTDSQQSPG